MTKNGLKNNKERKRYQISEELCEDLDSIKTFFGINKEVIIAMAVKNGVKLIKDHNYKPTSLKRSKNKKELIVHLSENLWDAFYSAERIINNSDNNNKNNKNNKKKKKEIKKNWTYAELIELFIIIELKKFQTIMKEFNEDTKTTYNEKIMEREFLNAKISNYLYKKIEDKINLLGISKIEICKYLLFCGLIQTDYMPIYYMLDLEKDILDKINDLGLPIGKSLELIGSLILNNNLTWRNEELTQL